MTETVSSDGSSVAKPVSGPRSRKPATVSASALALHLDCSRTYLGKLEADGVIQRQGEGFPLDQSRVAYLRYLRRERRPTPRGDADADFQNAKAELIRLRIAEKKRDLIPREEAGADMEELIGLFLTGLSSFPARCGGRDLQARCEIERAARDLRIELADAANKLADQRGESKQGDDDAR